MLGLCVLVIHFGGMAAMEGHAEVTVDLPRNAMSHEALLIPVLAICALIMTLGFFGYLLDSRSNELFRTESQWLRQMSELTGLANEVGPMQKIEELAERGQPFLLRGVSIARYRRIRLAHGDATAQHILAVVAERLVQNFGDSVFVAHGREDWFYILADTVGAGDSALAIGPVI